MTKTFVPANELLAKLAESHPDLSPLCQLLIKSGVFFDIALPVDSDTSEDTHPEKKEIT